MAVFYKNLRVFSLFLMLLDKSDSWLPQYSGLHQYSAHPFRSAVQPPLQPYMYPYSHLQTQTYSQSRQQTYYAQPYAQAQPYTQPYVQPYTFSHMQPLTQPHVNSLPAAHFQSQVKSQPIFHNQLPSSHVQPAYFNSQVKLPSPLQPTVQSRIQPQITQSHVDSPAQPHALPHPQTHLPPGRHHASQGVSSKSRYSHHHHSVDRSEEEEIEPETAANYYEGDIAYDDDDKYRFSINFDKFPAKKWPNNTVPYLISELYSPREVRVIESAIKTISFLSCVQFVPRQQHHKDYLNFKPSNKRKGCWSYIGRQGGSQQISLQRPDSRSCHCLCSPGRAIHEVLHSLGFYHEHARSDRDKYIDIVWANVRKGKKNNFNTKKTEDTKIDFEYDYRSIMHYGKYYFSKNKRKLRKTIVPKKNDIDIGQRVMLSKVDCMKINNLYNCFTDQETNVKIQIICAFIGY